MPPECAGLSAGRGTSPGALIFSPFSLNHFNGHFNRMLAVSVTRVRVCARTVTSMAVGRFRLFSAICSPPDPPLCPGCISPYAIIDWRCEMVNEACLKPQIVI